MSDCLTSLSLTWPHVSFHAIDEGGYIKLGATYLGLIRFLDLNAKGTKLAIGTCNPTPGGVLFQTMTSPPCSHSSKSSMCMYCPLWVDDYLVRIIHDLKK